MDSLLVPRSTKELPKEFHNTRETIPDLEPIFNPCYDTDYEDMLLIAELPSPPDSPRSSERPDSPEYEEYLTTPRQLSPEGKKLAKLLRIRKVLYSYSGNEIRDEVIRICGRFAIPVHDHLNYKQLKKARN
jgi:hypothetical protein